MQMTLNNAVAFDGTVARLARLRPRTRKDQLLMVAEKHFAEHGYDGASMIRIAREANVARALLYHYYPGKDALLVAVLERQSKGLLMTTEPDPMLSTIQNLTHALSVYIDHLCSVSNTALSLYVPNGIAPQAVQKLASQNHTIQITRLLTHLNLEDTPLQRVALGSWLSFVVEAARASNQVAGVSREEIVALCVKALGVSANR